MAMARWTTTVNGAAAILLFLQSQQQFCHHCPMSIFVASSSLSSSLISHSVSFPLMVTLDTLPRIYEGTCPKPVRTIKSVLRKPLGLSRKQPSPPFRASAIYCLLSRQRWDLTMLTLLLKWPPASLPFTGLWWNPVPPFIPTCAPQIFKLSLHKHCCAGEMIPNPFWSKPAAL